MPDKDPVAIIGMGCLFPKSADLKDYWQLLYHGKDAITDIPESHWSPSEYFNPDPKSPDHVHCKRGGFLSPISFDPSEFGILPSALEATDTSQLLGLLAAKMALEDCGYGGDQDFDRDRTAVILGVTGTQELVIPLSSRLGHPKWRKALEDSAIDPQKTEEVIQRISDSYTPWQENSFPGLLGNVVAGRISNRLNLRGTNCVVDAACASALSALHLALLELQSGRSDMVVTGGVDTLNDIFMHMCFAKTQALSATGDARPFSRDADGTVLGEGIGILVLKRLEAAQKDGNRIYALIKGLGSSSDGKSQSIYSPSPEGQARALRSAYENAAINPATIGLIEAHGTGTRVGDKVEFEALNTVFGEYGANGHKSALGSVKSMIGHTKASAGAAGLIKTALSLYHKVLPPTLKAETPHPSLDIASSHFYLNTKTRPWFSPNGNPRRAGVSAFGFGGSNFHVVLEEYHPEKPEVSWDGSVDIIAFSADNIRKLARKVRDYRDENSRSQVHRESVIQAAESRRRFSPAHPCRLLIVHEHGSALSDLLDRALAELDSGDAGDKIISENIFFGGPEKPGKLAFVFPGQGSQYLNMGRDMICTFPSAMQSLASANKKFDKEVLLSDLIFPQTTAGDQDRQQQEATLRKTNIAQPAIGAISLAMLNVLKSFDVRPAAACGHSFGELTALCAAGWIDDDTLLELAIKRGRLMAEAGGNQDPPGGAMLAVQAPLEDLEDLLQNSSPEVVLANRNSPRQGVLSGPTASILEIEKICRQNKFNTSRLPVSAAFHSDQVKTASRPFQLALKKVAINPTAISVFSNTTGKAYPADANAARSIIGSHLACPVDFVSEIENLYATGIRTFVEIGPKSVLTGLISAILPNRDVNAWALDASAGTRYGIADLARLLSRLAALGYPVALVEWENTHATVRKSRMNVLLSGTNYKNQKPDDKGPKIEHPSTPDGFVAAGREQRTLETVSLQRSQGSKPTKPTHEHNNNMSNDNSKQSAFILDALKVVQEGLKSMQHLQSQTAAAHQKFLDTQTEANRSLQAMMQNTQRLTEQSLGLVSGPLQPVSLQPLHTDIHPELPAQKVVSTPVKLDNFDDPQVASPLAAGEKAPEMAANGYAQAPETSAAAIEKFEPHRQVQHPIEATLLEVVSHLTGYPIEMLGLDMDIEAELGIDSIKRVEILSTLEEKMPDLPTVSPEIMGSLKTLGQIVEYLTETDNGNGVADNASHAAASADNGAARVEPPAHADRAPDVEATLLGVVSQLTGYPIEMLGLDMDIEAELGIDSIKRVEILSTLEEKMPGLPTVSPEIMGSLKTLGQIVEYLAQSSRPGVHPEAMDETPKTTPSSKTDSELDIPHARKQSKPDGDAAPISRSVVSIVDAPAPTASRLALAEGRKVFVTEDNTGLSEQIAEELTRQGFSTVRISLDILKYKNRLPAAAGLIIVQAPGSDAVDQDLKQAFALAKYLAPSLMESAEQGGAIFATVTRLDGAFGLKGGQIAQPAQGGLAGLVKTAVLEWQNVCCRAIDIAPAWTDNRQIANAVAKEVLSTGPIEIGLDSDRRYTLSMQPQPSPGGHINLVPGDVVVISGGARGITAATALALARETALTLILLGRSPQPVAEPEWLSVLSDEAAIKKAILKNDFSGQKVTPAEIENVFKRHMANREIAANLVQLKSTGAEVYYYETDIRDFTMVQNVMADIRNMHGPIAGIFHGAGVLEDRLIIDKTVDQFERVFDTKVKGLENLLANSDQDQLKYLVLFSSIAARMGNRGQADYAMANEVLNKMALNEAARRPDCRVVAINWGPWDGGMVTSALKREFERNGIGLIPVDHGVQCMLDEMKADSNKFVEVVIGAKISNTNADVHQEIKRPELVRPRPAVPKQQLSLSFERDIGIAHYPILKSHVIDGKPVVPMALMTEWFAHGALHENPGLVLHGLDDIRVLKGIRLESEKKHIRLLTGKLKKAGDYYEVPVELRDGKEAGRDIIHSSARAILSEQFPSAPPYQFSKAMVAKAYDKKTEDVYDKILFHGNQLHGIRQIVSCSSRGMVAHISPAPAPDEWISTPLRNNWIGDPLVLDSAFQMATVWCYEEKGIVSLPSYAESYRQYCSKFPSDGVTAVLEIREATSRKMRGDFTFLDSNDEIVASLSGFEAILDPSLLKAFKPQYKASA
ncbi:MAG: SDR family NAD(P)-dependent oxidoreductase [Desulfobacteraceae bacterium]|jgi:acyl transferase domain-containing protein/NAD(P)-dependent dehydrogenase (short-subunit alcohol dehydrogenase family)|nr:SDR family NAD(P)-dependent oxidoreductase [Desulfobacteraceae bacterium]